MSSLIRTFVIHFLASIIRPQDKSVLLNNYFLISTKPYVVVTQKNSLNVTQKYDESDGLENIHKFTLKSFVII